MGSFWSRLLGGKTAERERVPKTVACATANTCTSTAANPTSTSKERSRGRTRTRTRTPPPPASKSTAKSTSREKMPGLVKNVPDGNNSNAAAGNRAHCAAPKSSTATAPHEFVWKSGGAKVCLTGNFDGWSQGILMARDQSGIFRATVNLDPQQKWCFKFVVDGVWRCSLDFASETDEQGNVNNVIYPIGACDQSRI